MIRARVLACLASLCVACGGESIERVPPESAPAFLRASPESVGLDGAHLSEVTDALPPDHGLQALLVVRSGRLVFERYFAGYDENSLHDLRSVTKSLTSLVVGSALDRGELDLSDSALTFLGESYPETDASLSDIELRHLLTMRSGLDCDDSDPSTRGQEDRMYESEDWVGFFLGLSLVDAPGSRTRYCTGNVVALGRIVEVAAHRRFDELARERLFEPLGIEHFRFETFDGGRGIDSGGHLHLRPRDLAKVGELVLGRGVFRGERVISADFVDEATRKHTDYEKPHTDYGYLFWLDRVVSPEGEHDVIYASGNGGQALFVVPDLELVSVVAAGNYNSERAQLSFQWFASAALGSVTGSDS